MQHSKHHRHFRKHGRAHAARVRWGCAGLDHALLLEVADALARERRVHAVGIDTPSIDHGPSQDFAAHVELCAANVAIFENVGAMDDLPARGFDVVALPMKIAGGSGGPLRVVGFVPN